jgi:small-conductance mechanosensitive channel
MKSLLAQRLLGNDPLSWIISIGAAAFAFVLLLLINRFVVRKLRSLAARTSTQIDDVLAEVLSRTSSLTLFVIATVLGAQFLTLRPALESALLQALWLTLLAQFGLWGNGAISFWLERSMQQSVGGATTPTATMSAIGFVARVALWSLVILMGLSNIGVDITGLIAGLGIGGIAVALALQNVLSDLFASLSIVLDKPFVIGDFIIVDQMQGTVEYVGLKTTRLRSISGEQLIVSNADLLRSRIRNLKRMDERRALFQFGITYRTPADTVAKVGAIARQAIESQSGVRFERAHFKEFGESALVFECVYYVLSPDYNRFMDIQEQINLALLKKLRGAGAEFAYPTRTLVMQPADGAARKVRGRAGGKRA